MRIQNYEVESIGGFVYKYGTISDRLKKNQNLARELFLTADDVTIERWSQSNNLNDSLFAAKSNKSLSP